MGLVVEVHVKVMMGLVVEVHVEDQVLEHEGVRHLEGVVVCGLEVEELVHQDVPIAGSPSKKNGPQTPNLHAEGVHQLAHGSLAVHHGLHKSHHQQLTGPKFHTDHFHQRQNHCNHRLPCA